MFPIIVNGQMTVFRKNCLESHLIFVLGMFYRRGVTYESYNPAMSNCYESTTAELGNAVTAKVIQLNKRVYSRTTLPRTMFTKHYNT